MAATAFFRCATSPPRFAVGPLLNLMIVLIVHAASAAVSGLPSDHFAFGRVWDVQAG